METLEALEAAAAAEIERAAAFALASPQPDPAHVLDDVFYEGGESA